MATALERLKSTADVANALANAPNVRRRLDRIGSQAAENATRAAAAERQLAARSAADRRAGALDELEARSCGASGAIISAVVCRGCNLREDDEFWGMQIFNKKKLARLLLSCAPRHGVEIANRIDWQ